MTEPGGRSGALRIANCSGFFGDRAHAAREMVEGGPIDVLTGDWLAELTMYILHKTRQRSGGYARAFHNLRAGADRDIGDDAGERRAQRVLHLHGLDHGQTLTAGNGVPGANEELQDFAVHRRLDDTVAGACFGGSGRHVLEPHAGLPATA
jgi:hypothetical protein